MAACWGKLAGTDLPDLRPHSQRSNHTSPSTWLRPAGKPLSELVREPGQVGKGQVGSSTGLPQLDPFRDTPESCRHLESPRVPPGAIAAQTLEAPCWRALGQRGREEALGYQPEGLQGGACCWLWGQLVWPDTGHT